MTWRERQGKIFGRMRFLLERIINVSHYPPEFSCESQRLHAIILSVTHQEGPCSPRV